MNEFSTFDVVKILAIKRDRLKDWMTREHIKPSIQEAKGQGTKALFNRADLYAIQLFQHLLNRGFPRKQAAKYVNNWRTAKAIMPRLGRAATPDFEEADHLVLTLGKNPESGKEIVIQTIQKKKLSFKEIEEKLGSGIRPDIFIINFKRIRAFVDQRIAEKMGE